MDRDRLITAMLNREALRRAQTGDTSPFQAPQEALSFDEPDAPEPMQRAAPQRPQRPQRRGTVTTRSWLEEPQQSVQPTPVASYEPSEMPEGAGTRLPPWIAAHPESGKRWEYSQSTGQLSYDGVPFGDPGYAGRGEGLNNPEMQGVRNTGPVPQGDYTMGDTSNYNWNNRDHPYATPLIPASGNDMQGRSGFLIHGGPKQPTWSASEGCIIMPDGTRIYLDRTQNRNLRVTA